MCSSPHFLKCLEKISQQHYSGETQLIVVDSGSTDGTPEAAEEFGALVKRIDKKEFHHARTRNQALASAKFNKVIYTVQDAIPCSNAWLSDLEQSLNENGDVVAVYTDQTPHEDASLYARFDIDYLSKGMGQEPTIQSIESPEQFRNLPYDEAYRAIRLDNVCAIYRKELLFKIPFPEVDFAEDLAWAHEILTTVITPTAPRSAACTPSKKRSSPKSTPTVNWIRPSFLWT